MSQVPGILEFFQLKWVEQKCCKTLVDGEHGEDSLNVCMLPLHHLLCPADPEHGVFVIMASVRCV